MVIVILFISLIAVFIFYQVFRVFQKRYAEWKSNNEADKQLIPAILIYKRIGTSFTSRSNTSVPSNPSESIDEYVLTFENLINGERHVFDVESKHFDKFFEGEKGDLHFQGTRFLNFSLNSFPNAGLIEEN